MSPEFIYFFVTLKIWMVLYFTITPTTVFIANRLWSIASIVHKPTSATNRWGDVIQNAYNKLSPTKQAYWRRLLRSYVYYILAALIGLFLLLSSFRSVSDLFFVFTPFMSFSFSAAASHFMFNIYEDYHARMHMGRTKKEVFWVYVGYVIHHCATAIAYLIIAHTHELGTMGCIGLAFEGPVFFATIREFISVFHEDFDLYNIVPRKFLWLNWTCTFIALVICRYPSVFIYFYAPTHWLEYMNELTPTTRNCFYFFGGFFTLINVYYTWLLKYWYGQDVRFTKKLDAQGADKMSGQRGASNAESDIESNIPSKSNTDIQKSNNDDTNKPLVNIQLVAQ